MGNFHCGLSLLFTIMTLFTIGVTTVVFGFMLYYFKMMAITEASDALYAVLIIGLCVSLLILIYGTYASCCGGRCHKVIISLIYIIWALVLLAVGIYVLGSKGKLLDMLGEHWDANKEKGAISTAEQELKCSGWNVVTPGISTCKEVISGYYNKYGKPCAGVLIVLSLILFVGVFLAFKMICRKTTDERGSSSQQGGRDQFTTPLTYGW